MTIAFIVITILCVLNMSLHAGQWRISNRWQKLYRDAAKQRDDLLECVRKYRELVGTWEGICEKHRANTAQYREFLEKLLNQLRDSNSVNAASLAHDLSIEHSPDCGGHCLPFECGGCRRTVGMCLGCADEHYDLCDGCAGQEVTR